MYFSITKQDLLNYTLKQVNFFFPSGKEFKKNDAAKEFDLSVQRMEKCFSKIKSKYYREGAKVIFNHLNGDHYSTFLYFFANTLYSAGKDISFCTKLFLLNKLFHGIDLFYEVKMPDIFLLSHPQGTVLGRAEYSDYFIAYQQCNVGSNNDIYPKLGKYVTLHPRSSVLGNCHVGNNCSLAAGSLLIDRDLKNGFVYFGYPKYCHVKKSSQKNSVWV